MIEVNVYVINSFAEKNYEAHKESTLAEIRTNYKIISRLRQENKLKRIQIAGHDNVSRNYNIQ